MATKLSTASASLPVRSVLTYADRVETRNAANQLHSFSGLPSVVFSGGPNHGLQQWHRDGKLHRDNREPAVTYANGQKEWWVNGVQDTTRPAILKTFDEMLAMRYEITNKIENYAAKHSISYTFDENSGGAIDSRNSWNSSNC